MSDQAFICSTCGVQYSPRPQPPSRCAICTDERQYVGVGGQQWTTHDVLVAERRARFETVAGIECIGIEPGFAIDQRAFVIKGRHGNVLWECVSCVAWHRDILGDGKAIVRESVERYLAALARA
jgi:hypothetical protein